MARDKKTRTPRQVPAGTMPRLTRDGTRIIVAPTQWLALIDSHAAMWARHCAALPGLLLAPSTKAGNDQAPAFTERELALADQATRHDPDQHNDVISKIRSMALTVLREANPASGIIGMLSLTEDALPGPAAYAERAGKIMPKDEPKTPGRVSVARIPERVTVPAYEQEMRLFEAYGWAGYDGNDYRLTIHPKLPARILTPGIVEPGIRGTVETQRHETWQIAKGIQAIINPDGTASAGGR